MVSKNLFSSKSLFQQKLFSSVITYTSPFPHYIISHFLPDSAATKLTEELLKELFEEKKADLFHFYQTKDLISSKNKIIQEFRHHLLNPDFFKTLQDITGKKLNIKHIDFFGSIYENTHFLLPHDDQLEGRAIAFIYYLSDLTQQDGGALALYDSKNNQPTKVAKRIIPQFNTFVFFEVSSKSFHEVEEVIKDTQRLTFTGWFHHA
ncbi:2OG-Fe(II) oxygenase [Candidatus Woesearchaeota archaeon]|nr:2OG-Fe(II) oxygenase [Candidatus Woesearchaeota archaeon]